MKSARKPLVYLASPYSHPDPATRQARYVVACMAAGELIRAGLVVYSPIAHSHGIAILGGTGLSWEDWQVADVEMLRRSECVVVLMSEGWERSVGIGAEVAAAREVFHLPVVGICPDDRVDWKQFAELVLGIARHATVDAVR